MTYVPPISRLELMKFVYLKLSDVTPYSQSKQTVMSASDYTHKAYLDVRIVLQLMLCCVCMGHFIDIWALINVLFFQLYCILYFMYSLCNNILPFRLILNKIWRPTLENETCFTFNLCLHIFIYNMNWPAQLRKMFSTFIRI